MKKLEIEIPNDKEIDWEASAQQQQIVFKDKQLTYEDMCQKLFRDGYCFIGAFGQIVTNGRNENYRIGPSNAKTSHQLECILAKNKLANTARYLNGEWEWEWGSHDAFFIMDKSDKKDIIKLNVESYSCYPERMNILFKSKDAALKAIEILGEETVKLALTPLY